MYITNITIQVPYKSAGNIIVQKPVEFEVYREEAERAYKAIPILTGSELRLANLPKELKFIYKNGKITSLHGIKDTNLYVMEDIYTALSDINFKTI